MSPQAEKPLYAPDKFVDRERETEFVLNKARLMAQGSTLDRRTVIFVGHRGIGKSWLLAHLQRELAQIENSIVALLDLAQYADPDPVEAVTRLLNQVRGQVLHQPEVVGQSPTEMSWQLMQDIHLAEGLLAVLVDSVYESDRKVLAVTEDYLLGPLAVRPNVLIVMAGRGRPYPWKTPELRLKADFLKLSPFEQVDLTIEQLSRQQHQAVSRGTQIHRLSGGNPLANFLLASHNEPVEALAWTIDGMLEIIDPAQRSRMKEYLEALCVLRTFDEERIPPLLAAYYDDVAYLRWSYVQARRAREEIVGCGFAGWNETQGGYVTDEFARRLIHRYLKRANLSLWQILHCTAYRLYREWMEKYPRSRERWQPEVDYHHSQLKGSDFLSEDCFSNHLAPDGQD